MPIGAFRINSIAKRFTVAVEAEVIRSKKGVTAIGNAQVDTAQSKFGGASALFDGTGDSLLTSTTEKFNLGTNDFTFEGWVRTTSLAANQIFLDFREASSSTVVPLLQIDTDGRLNYYVYPAYAIQSNTGVIAVNTWYHFALVRSSGVSKLFLNGTQVGSNYTDTADYGSRYLRLGKHATLTNALFGHLDEIRISNSARYTANFTAPAAAFVNDENTLLLLHMDGTDAATVFEDDNGVRQKKPIIALGTAQVSTAQSKFSGSSISVGADGTNGEYIYVPINSNADIRAWGTNDGFTFELWVRHTSLTDIDDGGSSLMGIMEATDYPFESTFGTTRSGTVVFNYTDTSGTINYVTTSGITISANTWYHYAFVKNGSNLKIYVNGTSYASHTITTTPRSSIGRPFVIGSQYRVGARAYVDEIRISNTARYTAGFTAPTAPFVNDANTLLLIHADGTNASTFVEDDNGVRAKKGVTALGNAQVDTAQSKFGGASALFDGTGDYLQAGSTGDFQFTAGNNVTMELWFRIDSTLTGEFNGLISMGSVRGSSSNEWNLFIMTNSATGFNRRLQMGHNFNILVGSTTNLNVNQWYHVAATRNGTTFTLWLDGVSQGTSTNTLTLGQNTGMKIGSLADGTLVFNKGHIDEVRVSNTARYTEAFTAPTTMFQNDSNTLLLLHCDGTDGSTVFTDDNGVPPDHDYGA